MSETSKEAIARAYARMDAETEAYSRGEEVAADKRLNDAREGKTAELETASEILHLPDLPPVEELVPVVTEPVLGSYCAVPDSLFIGPPVRPPFEYRGRYDADAMCAVWARVRKREKEREGGPPPRPKGTKSQLLGARTIADSLAEPVRIVEPTPDEQVADEVERTAGFVDVRQSLWLRYVVDYPLTSTSEEEVLAFLERLHERWPHGFTPDPQKRIRPRSEELKEIEEEVEGARRKRDRRRWSGRR